MNPTFDVRTSLFLARQHQADVRASFPQRRRASRLRHRSERTTAVSRVLRPARGPAPGAHEGGAAVA